MGECEQSMDSRIASGPANPPPAWGLDPIWDSYAKASVSLLRDAVTKAMAPKQPQPCRDEEVLVFGAGRVVTRVRLLGYIVSVKDSSSAREFLIDDGTGLLSCILFRNDSSPNPTLSQFLDPDVKLLGLLIHVGGPVDVYGGKPQLKVFFASVEQDVHGEVLFWLDTLDLHASVYSNPFTPLVSVPVSLRPSFLPSFPSSFFLVGFLLSSV